ncbi:hypothetical protein AAVH_41058, partial [Aphelenchoides avenae]
MGNVNMCSQSMTLLPDQWTTLTDAIRKGAVERLHFSRIEFSALDNDALLVAVGCRGLESLGVRRSVVPRGFVTDDLLRSSVAQGLLELSIYDNVSDLPHRISDDVFLDLYCPSDAAPATQPLSLDLEGSGLTEKFMQKFFEVSDFVMDDLIQGSVAKGLLKPCILGNDIDLPHRMSENAVMDVIFPAKAPTGIQPFSLKLNRFWLTNRFLGKFFE